MGKPSSPACASSRTSRRARGRQPKTLRREEQLRAAAEASRGIWHNWTFDYWCDAAAEQFPDEAELFDVEKSVRWEACRRVRSALEAEEQNVGFSKARLVIDCGRV